MIFVVLCLKANTKCQHDFLLALTYTAETKEITDFALAAVKEDGRTMKEILKTPPDFANAKSCQLSK